MSRLAQHSWVGESGEQYLYFIRAWPTRLAAVPGTFILARVEGSGDWKPMLIGECSDLSAIAENKLTRCLDPSSVTHIHTRPTLHPSSARQREVADLVARWKPSVNSQGL